MSEKAARAGGESAELRSWSEGGSCSPSLVPEKLCDVGQVTHSSG